MPAIEGAIGADGIRLSAFVATLAVLVVWELGLPRRRPSQTKTQRWVPNFCLLLVNTLILRLCFPITALSVANIADANQWGLFNRLPVATWVELMAALLILDFAIYLQHRLFHKLPVLWRIHRVHHADLEFDVSTGPRFHPLEMALSLMIKVAVVFVLGAPPLAVITFEILLSSASLFNHTNGRLLAPIDRFIRTLLVTPDMHRIHHSRLSTETNRNFGFCLSCWDRLFGTYQHQPREGHEAMKIGLEGWTVQAKCQPLTALLLMPLRRD